MKKTHIVFIAGLALGFGFIISWMVFDSKPVKLEATQWFGDQAKILPDFKLIDHNNQVLGKEERVGRWSIMYFGYTHCPDVCPIDLNILGEMLNAIDDSDTRRLIRVIFVSVDPERDTPAVLKSYLQNFHPEIIGASAPAAELNILTHAIGIPHSHNKNHEHQAVYDVSHSSVMILLNPEGKYAGVFSAPQDSTLMARDLGKIIDSIY
jgi:protein SCO1/2